VKSFTHSLQKVPANGEHFVCRWAWDETGAGKQFRPTAAISEDRTGLVLGLAAGAGPSSAAAGWATYWRGVGALPGEALLPGNSACTMSAIQLVFG